MRFRATPALILLIAAATVAEAQEQRRRVPGPDGGAPPAAAAGIPRDPRMPYAGLWTGVRMMPMGPGPFSTRLMVADGKYQGEMIFPDGGTAPWRKMTATSGGLTWESPNSGGGTWVYSVQLAGPDSMVGTLFLRDAPPQFNPVPKGTIVLKRQAAGQTR